MLPAAVRSSRPSRPAVPAARPHARPARPAARRGTARVGVDRDVRVVRLVQVAWVVGDVDQHLARGDRRREARPAQAQPDDQDRVCRLEEVAHHRALAVAGHTGRQGMRLIEAALAHERRHDRRAQELGDLCQLRAGLGVEHPWPDHTSGRVDRSSRSAALTAPMSGPGRIQGTEGDGRRSPIAGAARTSSGSSASPVAGARFEGRRTPAGGAAPPGPRTAPSPRTSSWPHSWPRCRRWASGRPTPGPGGRAGTGSAWSRCSCGQPRRTRFPLGKRLDRDDAELVAVCRARQAVRHVAGDRSCRVVITRMPWAVSASMSPLSGKQKTCSTPSAAKTRTSTSAPVIAKIGPDPSGPTRASPAQAVRSTRRLAPGRSWRMR